MGFFNTLGLLAGWLVFQGADKRQGTEAEALKHGRKLDHEIEQETGLLPPAEDFSASYADAIVPRETERVSECCAALEKLYVAIGWKPVSFPIWQIVRARQGHQMIITLPRITRDTIHAGLSQDGALINVIGDSLALSDCRYNPTGNINTVIDNVRLSLDVYRQHRYVIDSCGSYVPWFADPVRIVQRSSAQVAWFDQVAQRIFDITRYALEAAYSLYAVQHGWRVLPDMAHKFGHMTWTEYAQAAREHMDRQV